MAGEQAHTVLEVVVYSLKAGAAREDFLRAGDGLTKWLTTQPGFVSREVAYAADDNRWIEAVRWRSVEDFQSSLAAVMSSPDCAPFFALIDMDSVLQLYGELLVSAVRADG